MLTSAFAPISGRWFTTGTDRGQEDERPPHRVLVDPFELAVFPDAVRSRRPGRRRSASPQTSASWASPRMSMCRVTLRSKLDPSFRYNDYGFRIARSL